MRSSGQFLRDQHPLRDQFALVFAAKNFNQFERKGQGSCRALSGNTVAIDHDGLINKVQQLVLKSRIARCLFTI